MNQAVPSDWKFCIDWMYVYWRLWYLQLLHNWHGRQTWRWLDAIIILKLTVGMLNRIDCQKLHEETSNLRQFFPFFWGGGKFEVVLVFCNSFYLNKCFYKNIHHYCVQQSPNRDTSTRFQSQIIRRFPLGYKTTMAKISNSTVTFRKSVINFQLKM